MAAGEKIIGIDLGTTNSVVSVMEGSDPKVIANAEGEASRFRQILVEYSKAPEVTRQRMYIETVQQMLANSSKIMLDAKGSGNLLYLPLDKLMQAAATAPAAAATSDSAGVPQRAAPNLSAEVPPQLDAATRSREALRSRERGER